ncbi:MAG TPA: aquaporin [Pyrinomonadaceae bacterium]|nr:aquaporin [Pyrinomonadaceae bacterium]
MSHPLAGSVPESLRSRMMSSVTWTFPEAPESANRWDARMLYALRNHWPEYLIEAAGLGVFMISACAFATLLFHPASPLTGLIVDPIWRRVLMGAAMGLTAIAIVYSPWGKRSGAHINPSVTLAFFRLGKIEPWDALFYTLAQFAGGITGVILAALILGSLIADPSVNYVATVPGPAGPTIAFIAEVLISFILMSAVLFVSNAKRLNRWTGLIAGALVATYISLESPLSGMSMNPARTFGSAVPGRVWMALWIYFTAPPLGMLLAAELYTRLKGEQAVACAKLHHRNNKGCIFRCGYGKAEVV